MNSEDEHENIDAAQRGKQPPTTAHCEPGSSITSPQKRKQPSPVTMSPKEEGSRALADIVIVEVPKFIKGIFNTWSGYPLSDELQ